MTDSLSVQPQIQKKDNTVPYALGGAAVGGLGGIVAANYGYGIKSKPDLDKVFAMDPDTFKKHIENAGENKGAWETAQEWTKKIQDAEKDYDAQIAKLKEEAKTTSVENLPAENDAKKTLDEAREKYDNKLKELVDTEKAKLEAGNSINNELDSTKLKSFADVEKKYNLPTEYAVGPNKGKKIPVSQMEIHYNALTNNLRQAQANLDTTLNNGLRKTKKNALTDIKNIYTDLYNSTKGLTENDLEKVFSQKEVYYMPQNAPTGTPATLQKTPQYNKITQYVDKIYNDPTSLSDEQFKTIASEAKPSSSYYSRQISVKDPNTGRNINKTLYCEQNAYNQLLNTEIANVKNMKQQLADQIFEEAKNAVQIQRQLADFDASFEKGLNLNQIKDLGNIYNSKTEKLDITTLITEGNHANGGYKKDIELLKTAKKSGNTTLPSGLSGNYGNITPEKALSQAEQRNGIFKLYNKSKKNLDSLFDASVARNNYINDLNVKIATEFQNNEALNKAREELVTQFPDVYGKATKLSADEIKTQAETKAKEAIKSLKESSDLEDAKKLAQKAAEKAGLVKEISEADIIEKLGTREEFVKNVKDDATKAVEKNLEKMKLASKTWTGLAAAGVLALAGIGIAALNKKDA